MRQFCSLRLKQKYDIMIGICLRNLCNAFYFVGTFDADFGPMTSTGVTEVTGSETFVRGKCAAEESRGHHRIRDEPALPPKC